jgi:diaminopimelate decarboxylase
LADAQHAALAQWSIHDDILQVGQMPLTRVAECVGNTPFYVYDRQVLKARVAALRSHIPPGFDLHYAVKANPMPALVNYMSSLVDGLDVASSGELRLALDTGMNPSAISFAGPGKRESELRQAVAAGVLVNVESAREVHLLATHARELHLPARVALRVNPSFELKASGMKMGGGAKQFGVDEEAISDVMAEIKRARLRFEGFHVFSGSQNLSSDAICESQRQAIDLAIRLAKRAPEPVRVVNIGGGFGIPYFAGERELDLEPIAKNLRSIVLHAEENLPGARIVLELGRYLVGPAGLYVCRVIDRKVSRGQVFLVVDGGLHHHLAASGNFGQVLRKNYPVVIGNRMGAAAREIASVVGPLCTPLDLLADRMELAAAKPGDLVVIMQSGAYGLSASPTAFLGHPPALEALI